jgi:hypothetical protein
VKPKTLAFLLLIGAGAIWGSVFGFCYWALSKFAKPVEFTPSPTWVQAPGGQMIPVTDDYLADHGYTPSFITGTSLRSGDAGLWKPGPPRPRSAS